MSAFNRFGATVNDVLRLLKDSGVDDSSALDDADASVSGSTVIEAALDKATSLVYSWMPASSRRVFDRVDTEIVEAYGNEGQTTVTLTLTPIVADSERVYVYSERPDSKPYGDGVDGSLNASTGVFTLSESLSDGSVAYASYKVDSDNAAFDVPALAEFVAFGAVADIGGRLYTDGTPQFQQIQWYRDRFYGTGPDDPGIQGDLKGGYLPADIARMEFWEPIEGGRTVGTVRKHRA